MEFSEIVMKRYATKLFDGKKIPEQKMHELQEIIRFAPSSLNLQPWKIKVVAEQKVKDELQAASWNQPQIGSCSHLLVFCADTDLEGLAKTLRTELSGTEIAAEQLEGYMKMIDGFVKRLPRGDRLSWAQRQCFLAVGNALNGAKSLGFDSCPMEGFDPKAYSKILGLPPNLVPTVAVPVGYAADKPRPKFRFSKKAIYM